MTQLWELFVRPLTEPAFQKALIGSIFVAIVCGVVGCFVILRRMAFLGDAISHAMLAGVTAGYLFMQIFFRSEAHTAAMLVGSLIAGFITVGLISFVSRVSRIKEDTAIGIMYTGIFAVGGILASIFSHRIHIDLYHFVTGMVLGVEDADLWMMAIVASIVISVVILFFRPLQITSFDPIMAASIGVPVVVMDYLLTTCTSLVVVSAVNIVGVILVVGLLVTPAATAYLLSDRLARMMCLAACFGILSVTAGLYMSVWIGNIATGPAIVIASTLQFLFVLAMAPKYGIIADWWRKRGRVPQQLVEDILGCFRHDEKQPKTIAEILAIIQSPMDSIQKALKFLQTEDLVSIDGDTVCLTDSGQEKSRRLMRAHRLWETYLERVGVPQGELHSTAHRLEHIYDEETVDYLDDKLGHPLKDPHGAEIPEDFIHLVPGEVIKSSLMRDGHVGQIVEVRMDSSKLQSGTKIFAGPRTDDGKNWNFRLEDGTTIQLDHVQADAVFVRLSS